MVAPGGWRVVPIEVERGGRRLQRFGVTRGGRFICECASPEELAAVGVPLAELKEDATPNSPRSLQPRADATSDSESPHGGT